MKTVKIPLSLFERLCDFFENLEFRGILLDLYTPDFGQLYDELGAELRKKHDALVKREAFQAYKCAADPVQREAARRRYLDHAGIQPNCRSTEEIPDNYL